MNGCNGRLLVFVFVAAVQLAVPAWMLIGRERTLREGQVFKFRTLPVDPSDAFRGRYVWLSLEPQTVKVQETGSWRYNQKAFAVLGTDTNGFAVVKRLSTTRPVSEPAVPIRVQWPDTEKRAIHIQWTGLDRYYMDETAAPRAESEYWKHSNRTNRTCYVAVRVRGADAIVEELYIEGQPVRAWLRGHPEKADK
jgi:uncharacterized membrane-anchored protein